MSTIAIVLLITCANLTNLLLVRAEGRQQGGGGARHAWGRVGRLARERLLDESGLLSVLGGLLGLGVAYAALRALQAIGPTGLPRLEDIALDGSALSFALPFP